MKKISLPTQILVAMLVGLALGVWATLAGGQRWVNHYLMPWGQIFLNLLKLIALPLVLASLVSGVASLRSVHSLSRLGSKTIGLYILTTVLAVSMGLLVSGIVGPGKYLSVEKREALKEKFGGVAGQKAEAAQAQADQSPLQPLVDMVPSNLVQAAGDNTRMLQVIVFAMLLGVALVGVSEEKGMAVRAFFNSFNDVMLRLTEIIMRGAPLGVLGLMAGVVVQIGGDDPAGLADLFRALLMYILCVLTALLLIILVNYNVLLRFFARRFWGRRFFKTLLPAQQLAFTTSSSAATLPATMECVEEGLGIPKKIAGFVLPLGATINMDGTSAYQAVATVFIAQAFGLDLSFSQYLTIILTATLASIGSAAVPGAGMVMLVIVLGSVGLGPEGLALIVAPDRLLDMARTVVNVTGDAVVTAVVAQSEGIHPFEHASNSES
ncbi:MAG: dicarboxylate/amino acid:cation symporter [Flavobacteriales bacterium]|nr:dicarboxylate/amino acid:cation symporter [Flavobacteriales bacterium]